MDGQTGPEPFVVLPFLPPTSNNVYVNARGGKGRFLSSEAKKFKLRAVSHIQSNSLSKIARLDRGGIYRVWYAFYFPIEELLNRTYGSGKKGAAETRYKRMDVENRLKLVADSLATAIGIDDCQFFEGGHSKLSASLVGGSAQIHVFLTSEDPKRFGLEVA
jgi:Holliday junction resolvase RusA-like endonuclease